MRSAAFLQSALVLISAIAFAAAQPATASPNGDDLDNLTDCIEKCGDKLAPQFESACGQGTVDHPTEEQQRCLCNTPGVMDAVKACIPTACPLDIVPDVLDFIGASCQSRPKVALNGTESTASGPSGTQTTQSASSSPSPSQSGTETDSASSSGSPSASDATPQSSNQPDGGNAAPTTSAAVWMAGSIAAAAAFAAMV